ncbi:MAG: hypothetical protein KA369_04895 [Spirochaetes bacterium]|nr:hypothetical protein [Spirochaetota bacterium]
MVFIIRDKLFEGCPFASMLVIFFEFFEGNPCSAVIIFNFFFYYFLNRGGFFRYFMIRYRIFPRSFVFFQSNMLIFRSSGLQGNFSFDFLLFNGMFPCFIGSSRFYIIFKGYDIEVLKLTYQIIFFN